MVPVEQVELELASFAETVNPCFTAAAGDVVFLTVSVLMEVLMLMEVVSEGRWGDIIIEASSEQSIGDTPSNAWALVMLAKGDCTSVASGDLDTVDAIVSSVQ